MKKQIMTKPSLPILTIRELRVVMDSDLARIYGVTTGRFNEAVKRNLKRFPAYFSFVVTREEHEVLISQNAISKAGRRIARQALDLLPPEKDAVLGAANLASLAEIQARTGATSDAVSNLRRLLSIPAGEVVSIARLKIDPVWDAIRNDPGFQELLAGKELVGPGK